MKVMRAIEGLALIVLWGGVVAAATYHLDAINGNDNTGTGTSGAPWQTIEKVRTIMDGNDTVLLHNGTYKGFNDFNLGSLISYTGWIVFRPAPGCTAAVDTVRTGYWNSTSVRNKYLWFQDVTINSQAIGYNVNFLRFTRTRLLDGISLTNVCDAGVESCRVERLPPWTGSSTIIDNTVAVAIRGGKNYRVEGCDITNTALAITCQADSVVIKNNHIHDITHDGIRVWGIVHGLLEGNRIHGLDDGVDDTNTTTGTGASWSRHCDGIQFGISGGPCSTLVANYDVTIRGNAIYDCESQAIQINNYLSCASIHSNKVLFENNIFGPTKANPVNLADPMDTVVFRNNSFVYFPAGRSYVSRFRTLTMDNYTFRVSDNYTQVYVYNNILVDVFGSTSDTKFNDYNLYRKNTQNRVLPRFTILDTTEQFSSPASFDGRLLSTSPAVNAGTRTPAYWPVHTLDFYGTPRDNRPDIGAYELPGQTPPVEPMPVVHPGQKTVFVDDFTDGDFALDPWLDSTGVQGLSWSEANNESCHYSLLKNTLLNGNSLASPGTVGSGWLWAGQGTNWLDYTLDFDATNAYLTSGDGPLLLARDKNNCYWLDISRDNGRLVRFLGGVMTVLDTSDAIEMPHSGKQVYRVSVTQTAGAITFTVDVGRNGSTEFTVTDTSAAARTLFGQGGGLGFHRDYPNANLRLNFDNIRATVSRFAAVGIAPHTMAMVQEQSRLRTFGNPATQNVVIGLDPAMLTHSGLLHIYDVSGTRMRSMNVPVGASSIVWDGNSDWGMRVPNGMYVIEIVTGESRETISVMLTR